MFTFTHERFSRRDAVGLMVGAAIGSGAASMFGRCASAAESDSFRTIPAVPGTMAVPTRRRRKDAEGQFQVVQETETWEASETAIIICDMWADHPCKMAAMRVSRMAPRMNEVISLARDHGVAIIHAPSSGVKYY